MSDIEAFNIEVAFALPHKQKIVEMLVEPGTTAELAVRKSGIERFFPGLQLDDHPLGIFGQTLGTKGLPPADKYELRPGDRVEIYRPLIADPKEVRRRRAKKAAEQNSA